MAKSQRSEDIDVVPGAADEMVPAEHVDHARIATVATTLWREAFRLHHRPLRGGEDHDALVEEVYASLQDPALPAPMRALVECLAALGDEVGQDAILQVVDEQRLNLPRGGLTDNAASLAVRLWLAAQSDDTWADALAFAALGASSRRQTSNRFHEFVWAQQRRRSNTTAIRQGAEAALEALLSAKRMIYQGVRVHAHASKVRIVVLLGGREQTKVLAAGRKREPTKMRLGLGDVLEFDEANGRLSVLTRYPSLRDGYRRAAGQILFGEPDCFVMPAPWDLDKLVHDSDVLSRARESLNLRHLAVRRLVWRSDDETRMTLEGAGWRRHIPPPRDVGGGRVVEVQLDAVQGGLVPTRLRATLTLPNRTACDSKHRRLVDQIVGALDVGDVTRQVAAFWSVSRGVHSARSIAAATGKDVRWLMQSGLLIAGNREFAVDEEGGDVELHTLGPRGRAASVSLGSGLGSAARAEDDDVLRGYRLDPVKMVARFARELRLRGGQGAVEGDWLWDAGAFATGATTARAVLALRPAPVGVGSDLLRSRAARGDEVVFVVPAEAGKHGLSPFVGVSSFLEPDAGLLARLLRAAGCSTPPLDAYAPVHGLAIGLSSRTVLLDRQPVTLSPGELAVLIAIAVDRREGRARTSKELNNDGPRANDMGDSVRGTKASMVRKIEAAFALLPRFEPGETFFTKRGGRTELRDVPLIVDSA